MLTLLPSHRVFTLKVMGMLFLAVAVFAWGLQYKMSLYNTSSSLSASVPHAKLLTQKERPASIASIGPDSAQDRWPVSYTIFLFVTILCALTAAQTLQILSRPLDKDSRKQRFSALDFFSFRPPPAVLPSN